MAIKETVKTLFGKVLNIGKPPEKEVLYKEVIRKKVPKESGERVFIENVKQSFKKVFSVKKDADASSKPKDTVVKKVPKKKTTAKKTSTKKTSTAKKKTTTSSPKKSPVEKKAVSKKTASTKTVAVKKPLLKKKVASKTTTGKKKTTAKKPPAVQKISKRDEKIALYIKDVKKHYDEVDEAFLAIIVKNLGPSIYRKDAELVSCSDPKELDTVRRNFLIKKLGIDASNGVLDAAIQDVCIELKGVRTKYRATFYYALAKKFKKESALS